MTKSTVSVSIDLAADGRHVGDLRVRWSDNSVPLGFHPVPIISLKNGSGPSVLMTGGTHGDEFEGPSALMRLVASLKPDEMTGQVIILPALNAPAVRSASRVSPLDGANLNRAFPGDSQGGVTQQIADFVEASLLPKADAAIDLHSGGKASFFQPCTLATRTEDERLFEANLALAEAFGLPLTWILSGFNDPRSLNSAAARAGVPMVATELGGGGGVDPAITDETERGLYLMLRHLGILDDNAPDDRQSPRKIEITSGDDSLFAPGEGIFDRALAAGSEVKAGQEAGYLHYVSEPRRASEKLCFPADGFVLAHTNRGYVARGDLLYLVAQDAD